jgi:hypothetical protein
MSFWKTLFAGGTKPPKDETAEAVFIYSQCERCQEKFRNRIDKTHDLLRNYADAGPAYTAHKELVGAYCRNIITIDLEFDEHKRLQDKSIQHGQFITREAYEEQESASNEYS